MAMYLYYKCPSIITILYHRYIPNIMMVYLDKKLSIENKLLKTVGG